jgi:hypothetical protein
MKEFIGLPIEGYINKSSALVPQRPIEELAGLLKTVLESPFIYAIRWRQYTPYFNDGDPCVFYIHGVYLKFSPLDGDVEDGDGDYEDGFASDYDNEYSAVLGGNSYNSETKKFDPVDSPNPELSAQVKALEKAMDSGEHDVALADLFGDHACVTATPEKFIVDEYEHE